MRTDFRSVSFGILVKVTVTADVCEHLVRQGLQIACTAIDSVYFGEDPLLGATDSSQLLNFSRDKLPDAENLSESFSFLYLGGSCCVIARNVHHFRSAKSGSHQSLHDIFST